MLYHLEAGSQLGISHGYRNAWEHYQDEQKRIDLLIRIQLAKHFPERTPQPLDRFKGLMITDEEVADLLFTADSYTDAEDTEQTASLLPELYDQLRWLESSIEQRLRLSEHDVELPLFYLIRTFDLSYWECQVILICLMIELDRKYEKLYAYLQDDVTSKYPTVELIGKLLEPPTDTWFELRTAFSPMSKLQTHFLRKSDPASYPSMLSMPLRLSERMVRFLIHEEPLDEEMDSFTEIVYPSDSLPELLVDEQIQQQIQQFATACNQGQGMQTDKNLLYYLHGPPGSGKKLHVKHFCRRFGHALLLVDMERLSYKMAESPQTLFNWFTQIFREAILLQAIPCFTNVQVLFADPEKEDRHVYLLQEAMKQFRGTVFLLADQSWQNLELQNRHLWMKVELNIPDESKRKSILEKMSNKYTIAADVDLGLVANKFRLTVGQIEHALQAAKNLSVWKKGSTYAITSEELSTASYMQVQHKLQKKAVRLQPRYSWDDVILPEAQKRQLRNACNQLKYRHIVFGEWGFEQKLSYGKGLSLLFSGPPGTGKTMSAEVIAKELELEIYKIDMSQVISKYIGETEQNLQEIFYEAQLSNAILFFDEADALFGKRSEVKDSHDKYANVETSFLLQKMEEYSGVSILASNFLQNIDEAFLRRLNFVIKFPFPDPEYRQIIWRSMFPQKAHLSADIDFAFIAEKFEIAGGNIKNAALSAAFLAAQSGSSIQMPHILRAVIQEVNKSGGMIRKDQLGEYAEELLQGGGVC